MSSSTPNSSVSNMACLPEEPELVAFGEDHTGVPSVTTTPNPLRSQGIQPYGHIKPNNGSLGSGGTTPSPPNFLPVSQPKVPNLKSGPHPLKSPTIPEGAAIQAAPHNGSGDANFHSE